jgi:hypothetical protein
MLDLVVISSICIVYMGRPKDKLKRKAGRPKKVVEGSVRIYKVSGKVTSEKGYKALPQDWEEVLLGMYAEGASDIEIMRQIWDWRGSFSKDLWERWIKEEVKFKEVIEAGKILSQAWWEMNGRKNIGNKGFNSVLWYMNMKNRFGWADTQNIEHKGSIEHIGVVRLPHKKGLDLPENSTISVNTSKQTVIEGEFTEK